jgi:hypothetical protein
MGEPPRSRVWDPKVSIRIPVPRADAARARDQRVSQARETLPGGVHDSS